MKKNLIIPVVICLIIGVVSFIIFNNRTIAMITLDINPSLEIKLYRNRKVKEVIALNDDGNNIIPSDLGNQSLDDVILRIIDNVIKEDYTYENKVTLLMYTTGKINSEEIKNDIIHKFGDKGIDAFIITYDSISDEEKELANKYNISFAKAAYINSMIKEDRSLDFENLMNKSVNDLKQINESIGYCTEAYIFDGHNCIKEINRVLATIGEVCPDKYYDYNGICYEENNDNIEERKVCPNGFTMENDTCVGVDSVRAHGICAHGMMYDDNRDICSYDEFIGDAYEFCRDSGRTLYEHKCLATKPTINGGCLGSDKVVGGNCVNLIDDYYASEWMCPNGKINSNSDGSLLYPDNKCYEHKETNPESYSCDEGYILDGKNCIKNETISPFIEVICPSGYSRLENGRCINYNNQAPKETGLVCNMEHSRLEGNDCVIYDIVEALSQDKKDLSEE